jgi:uncharacterized protein (TIGR02466 family)
MSATQENLFANSEFFPVFMVPVFSHIWTGSENLNKELTKIILEREKSNPGVNLSNYGGWQSTPGLQQWAGQPGKTLNNYFYSAIRHATALFLAKNGSPSRGEDLKWDINAWANVNRKGNSNELHMHPSSTWSGVYYVDAGDPVPEKPDSGNISFINPLLADRMSFFANDLPDRRSISAVSGQMVLFPSYLQHLVRPYYGERPRISIAMNARKTPYP